jgi:AcrR family transcriptional regulator
MEHSGVKVRSGPQDAGRRRLTPPAGGLRERSKARRRAAIIRAALTLFTERGYGATTIADIAAAAEVAPRTVAMYFPAKQDIAMARFSQTLNALTSALRERAPGNSVLEIVERWLRADEPGADRELRQLSHRMFAANPELNALRNARMVEAIAAGADAVAAETGLDPGHPGPRIAAVAAAAVLAELMDMPPGRQRDEGIDAGLRFLAAGVATLAAPDQ